MKKLLEIQRADMTKKLLVNIGEHRQRWLSQVAELSKGPVSEIVRVLIDMAAIEPPEHFVVKLEKARLKMKLDDIGRRERALQEEKERLVQSLSNDGGQDLVPAEERTPANHGG